MTPEEERRTEALDRFWDEVIASGPAADRPPEVDATPAEVIQWLRALGDAPGLEPARERVWKHLATIDGETRKRVDPMLNATVLDLGAPTFGANGRTAPSGWRESRFRPSRRGALAQLATAALLVLTLGSVYLAFVSQQLPGTGPTNDQVVIPALSENPVEFVWQTTGGPGLSLDDPAYLAVDPQGNLWIPDGKNGRFQIFAPDGTFLEAWGTPGRGDGQFNFVYRPFGTYGFGAVAWDAAGNLYVADPGNERIQKFGPDRSFLAAWGGEGLQDGQPLAAEDLAIDAQGRLYATDLLRSSQVLVFDGDGRFLTSWGVYGVDEGQLMNTGGIAVDAVGNIWVADYGSHRAQLFTPEGALLTAVGGFGRGGGKFEGPGDVAVDGRGDVYVTDNGNSRVQRFDGDGRFLAAWDGAGSGGGELTAPTYVAVDKAGQIYVGQDNDRVSAFRLLPPLAGSGASTSAGPAIETLLDATVEDLPPGDTDIWVERWRFRPGPAVFTQDPLGEPQVLAVEVGTLVGTFGGTERELASGDQLVVPAGQAVTLRNSGQDEAAVILVTFPSITFVTPRWDPLAVIAEDPIPNFTATLPGGTARVVVERQTVSPGAAQPPATATELSRIGLTAGRVGVTVVGENLPTLWESGRERLLVAGSWLPQFAPGTRMMLRNADEEPAVLYRVMIAPLGGE